MQYIFITIKVRSQQKKEIIKVWSSYLERLCTRGGTFWEGVNIYYRKCVQPLYSPFNISHLYASYAGTRTVKPLMDIPRTLNWAWNQVESSYKTFQSQLFTCPAEEVGPIQYHLLTHLILLKNRNKIKCHITPALDYLT